MSLEENKARVRQLYEEVFNKKNLAAIDDYFAPDVIDHSLPPARPVESRASDKPSACL